MKNKSLLIWLLVLGVIILLVGIIFLEKKNLFISKEESKIEIIDATYSCDDVLEKFYSDEVYDYYFSCKKSASVYVKLENGNKQLVVNALENNSVTIEELIKAGLKVRKVKIKK